LWNDLLTSEQTWIPQKKSNTGTSTEALGLTFRDAKRNSGMSVKRGNGQISVGVPVASNPSEAGIKRLSPTRNVARPLFLKGSFSTLLLMLPQ
jgi:hypothetical protein